MTIQISAVDSVLIAMIKASPTSHGSRLDCLHYIARSPEYDARWNDDGSLWISSEKVTTSTFEDKTEDQDEDQDEEVIKYREKVATAKQGSIDAIVSQSSLASRLLYIRSEKVKKYFTRDNAEEIILAGNGYDPHLKGNPNSYGWANSLPRSGYNLLKNVPENADKQWVAAFIELIEEVLRFKYPAHKFNNMATDYTKRHLDNLDRAKTEAREILIRLKGTGTDKGDLARKNIEKQLEILVAKAARLGVKLSGTIE